MKIPYYEFMELRLTLDAEIKAEAEEAKRQEQESKNISRGSRLNNIKTPNFKK